MSGSQYAGDPTNYPDDFTLVDDADPPTAAAMNVGLEALGDRTAYLHDKKVSLGTPIVVIATEDIVAPAKATHMILRGHGAGAGGGSGGEADAFADRYNAGGGGGGGSVEREITIPCEGGATYHFTVPAVGGAGGIGAGNATPLRHGQAGPNATVTHVVSTNVVATFVGAEGGQKGENAVIGGVNSFCYGRGGRSVRGLPAAELQFEPITEQVIPADPGLPGSFAEPARLRACVPDPQPQCGDHGRSPNGHADHSRGGPSPQGFAGGACAAIRTSPAAFSYRGGGTGGGGGAGPGGNGGSGGRGGSPNQAGVASNGLAGQPPADANSGAGGGGGGAAGYGSGGAGASASGAAGSGAKITVTFIGAL